MNHSVLAVVIIALSSGAMAQTGPSAPAPSSSAAQQYARYVNLMRDELRAGRCSTFPADFRRMLGPLRKEQGLPPPEEDPNIQDLVKALKNCQGNAPQVVQRPAGPSASYGALTPALAGMSQTITAQPPESVLPRTAPPTQSELNRVLDGRYFSPFWKYGFRIIDGHGVATVSNNAAFKQGDEILRVNTTGPWTFSGEHLCADGRFHPFTGTLSGDGGLELLSAGCGVSPEETWKLVRVEETATHDMDDPRVARMLYVAAARVAYRSGNTDEAQRLLDKVTAVTPAVEILNAQEADKMNAARIAIAPGVDGVVIRAFRAGTAAVSNHQYADAKRNYEIIEEHSAVADAGILATSRRELGIMYEKGLGVPPNFATAAFWYQRSIDARGDLLARARLGCLYANGLGVKRDREKAREILAGGGYTWGNLIVLLDDDMLPGHFDDVPAVVSKIRAAQDAADAKRWEDWQKHGGYRPKPAGSTKCSVDTYQDGLYMGSKSCSPFGG